MCTVSVLCLIAVPLPPGKTSLVVQLNNNNNNNNNNNTESLASSLSNKSITEAHEHRVSACVYHMSVFILSASRRYLGLNNMSNERGSVNNNCK
jgi:hypothetical protein